MVHAQDINYYQPDIENKKPGLLSSLSSKVKSSLYFGVTRFILDYSGLATCVASGLAFGDYNHAIIGESMQVERALMIGGGLWGLPATPGFENMIISARCVKEMPYDEIKSYVDDYTSNQGFRNFSAGMASWFASVGYGEGSALFMGAAALLTVFTTLFDRNSKKARRQLEKMVKETGKKKDSGQSLRERFINK